MSKQQLTIEHLAPYLPYQTPIMVETKKRWIRSPIHNLTHGTGIGTIGHLITSESFKIGLRPLSDLTKEIEHNGEKFVPWIELEENYREGYNDLCMEFNPFKVALRNKTMGTSELVPYELIQKLFEWHFDVFDLHSKGLCIYKDEI